MLDRSVTVSWTESTTLIDGIGEGIEDGDDHDDARHDGVCGLLDVDRILTDGLPRFPDGRGPLPSSLLRRIACAAEVTRIVFGPDSQVLDVGRSRRTVTGQLRRAVIVRDGHCTRSGCDEPPSRCDVHHAVTHWADGGDTSSRTPRCSNGTTMTASTRTASPCAVTPARGAAPTATAGPSACPMPHDVRRNAPG
jgi:hypothetical protein